MKAGLTIKSIVCSMGGASDEEVPRRLYDANGAAAR